MPPPSPAELPLIVLFLTDTMDWPELFPVAARLKIAAAEDARRVAADGPVGDRHHRAAFEPPLRMPPP